MLFLLVLVVLDLVTVSLSFQQAEDDLPVDYSGYKTMRVSLKSEEARRLVDLMVETEVVRVMDEGRLDNEVDLLVGPAQLQRVEEGLTSSGATYTVLSEDVGADIEDERAGERNNFLNFNAVRGGVPGFGFKVYYSLRYQHSFINSLVARNPSKSETFSIGTSYEGRDLKVIRISNDIASSHNKPLIWVDGGIHAREWISSMTVLYLANTLLGEIETGLLAQVTPLLEKYQFVLLPMSNPDGYEYSRTHDRFWRKTRRPSGCKYNYKREDGTCYFGSCYGIDPNRNFDSYFGMEGVSTNPCSDVYPGEKPFSEHNTRAMRDYLMKHIRKVELYLSFHSYAQLFLKPVGYDYDVTPPKDSVRHDAAGRAFVEAVYKTHSQDYSSIRGVELLPHSGSSMDWAYMEGITHSYTVELRDSWPDGRYGFQLPPSQIIPTGEENVRGFIALVNAL